MLLRRCEVFHATSLLHFFVAKKNWLTNRKLMNVELPMRFDNEYPARQPKMVLITLLVKPLLLHHWAKLCFGLSCRICCVLPYKNNGETIWHKKEELKNRGNSLNMKKVRETGVFNITAIFWRIVCSSMNFPLGLVEPRRSWLGKSVHI